jgi:hypothetical protein
MIYIANTFSLDMLASWRITGRETGEAPFGKSIVAAVSNIRVATVTYPDSWLHVEEKEHGKAIVAVNHPTLAAVMSDMLSRHLAVNPNRISWNLSDGDKILVGQYLGPDIQEGMVRLPEGGAIHWLEVSVK